MSVLQKLPPEYRHLAHNGAQMLRDGWTAEDVAVSFYRLGFDATQAMDFLSAAQEILARERRPPLAHRVGTWLASATRGGAALATAGCVIALVPTTLVMRRALPGEAWWLCFFGGIVVLAVISMFTGAGAFLLAELLGQWRWGWDRYKARFFAALTVAAAFALYALASLSGTPLP